MNYNDRYIVELAKAAILDIAPIKPEQEVDWKYIYNKLVEQNITGLLFCSIKKLDTELQPPKKFLSKKTAYIETGVNLEDLSAALDNIKPIKNDKFTVFTLGRVCVQKQPQLFNRIAELVPEARFVWIGNGELENLLTAPNIEVTGWKPRHEALAMAKGANAFVLCSLGEAIAMSLIENMYIKNLFL